MNDKDKIIEVAQFSSVYGVKGWIKVKSYTQPSTNIFNYSAWLLKIDNQWKTIQIEKGRPHGKTLVVKLADVNDRDQAQKLVGIKIAVYRSQLPETDDDEFYWTDLLGLDVVTVEGKRLGKISDLLETGSNDVLLVKGQQDGKTTEHLIPWLKDDVIKMVSMEDKLITVAWDTEL